MSVKLPLLIQFNCFNELLGRNDFLPIYVEFQEYKKNSTTHSRPTNKEQKEYTSISPLFGRDRYNTDDKLKLALSIEQLTHLHVKQQDTIWVDDDDFALSQWECTSDSYLIYSYFVYKTIRYYYIVAYIDNNAHANWQNEDAKKMWLERAREHRESTVKLINDCGE